jgi:hypothetical protein
MSHLERQIDQDYTIMHIGKYTNTTLSYIFHMIELICNGY